MRRRLLLLWALWALAAAAVYRLIGMAVSATPTKGDPKVLAQVSGLSNGANTTIYTAPANTRGAKVTCMSVVNTTTTAVTFTLKHKNSAGTRFGICIAITIPGDGVPVPIVGDNDDALIPEVYLMGGATADILDGSAGTNAVLDINVYGIEFDT